MEEKINLTDKNISIKTTNGTVVNVTCFYVEDKILEALFLSYLEQENGSIKAGESSLHTMTEPMCSVLGLSK